MSIDFRLRDFAYPYSILKLRRFFEKSQYFPKDELERFQLERLRLIVKHAYENVPYYSELFKKIGVIPDNITCLSDLKKIPVLTKEILRDNFASLTALNSSRFIPLEESTSGSAGAPISFLSDKASRVLEFSYYWRHWSWAGYRLGDRYAELSSHYFIKQKDRIDDIYSVNQFSRHIVLNSLKISPDTIKDFVIPIKKYKPKFLKGLASTLYFFALWMHRKGINNISFNAIFSTGEVLTEKYRNLIERVFNCPVLDSYGHMERTVAISQCTSGGYHINSDYGVMELVDRHPSSEVNGNIGSILATSLHNFAMPLIRYEVGDLVESYDDPPACPCGRRLPLIKTIHGRHEDVIITPDNRYITSIFIALNFVKGFRFGQFIQQTKKNLLVNLIKSRNFSDAKEKELLDVLRRFVGNEIKISFNYISTDEIEKDSSGKIRMVISLLKKNELQ